VGEFGELLTDQFRHRAVDPPDQVVLVHELVGVLDRELGLADAAHAVQRLNGDPLVAVQVDVDPVE
jgi:hypothetical protein